MKKLAILLFLSGVVLLAGDFKRAPNFRLRDINNRNFRLSQAVEQSEFTIINFWATWCVPCRAEMKKLSELGKEYKNKTVNIISISIDDPKTVGRVRSYVRANRITHKILLDTNHKVKRKYNIDSPPYTYIIDNNMNIRYRHQGYRKGDVQRLAQKIDSLLEENK